MRPLFDRVVLARIVVAILIVIPPLVIYQRTTTTRERVARFEQGQRIIARNQADLAQERIDRTIADCEAYNEERVALIATSEAIIRIAVSSSPTPLTPRDRLLLAAFVQRANRQISGATKPRKCTVVALGLQDLEGIVRQAPASVPSAISPPPVTTRPRSSSTVRPRPPTPMTTAPPKPACVRSHGRCHPKG